MTGQFYHGPQVFESNEGTRPITSVSTSVIGFVGTAPDAEDAKKAEVSTGSGSSGLTFTAKTSGVSGNEITVRLKNPAAINAALAVAVVNKNITVSLATNGSGAVTSTAAQVKTAVEAAAAATALVDVSGAADGDDTPGGSSIGAGVVVPSPTLQLSGGLDASFPLNTPFLVREDAALIARAGTAGTIPFYLPDIFGQSSPLIVVVRVEASEDDEEMRDNVLAGIQALLDAESLLGVKPKILIAPDFSANNKVVTDGLISIANKLAAFVEAAGPNTSDSAAIQYVSQFGSDRLEILDPFLVRDGVAHDPSAAKAGLIARIDMNVGPQKSPSNEEIYGFSGTSRPIAYRDNDPTASSQVLNANNITTVIRRQGFRFYGNRTTSSDPKWAFVSVRRAADMVNESILRAHFWATDQMLVKTYFASVVEAVNDYLRTLKNLGVIVDGRCWASGDLNTPANIKQGKAYFNYEFSAVYPAENPIFFSNLSDRWLADVLNGVATSVNGNA